MAMSFKSPIRSFVNLYAMLREEEPGYLSASDYHRLILSETDGNSLLKARLEFGKPFMASRLGNGELDCLRYFERGRKHGQPYPDVVTAGMGTNAGFFPLTDEALDGFCKAYLDAVRQADAMGVWFYVEENRVLKEHCPDASLVPPRALEPYYHAEPWSKALEGKRVLIVHPFVESIREQYANKRSLLFANPDVLPEFQLHTIKAVQSIAGEPSSFASWFDALESMKEAMDAVDYDVCIVGAGAYGLPLAAHAKRSGKQAIHMGGATQILFGIKGKRWDDHEVISKLYNKAWVRPKESETPRSFQAVEDGCYW